MSHGTKDQLFINRPIGQERRIVTGNFTAKGRKEDKFMLGVIIKDAVITHATLKAKRWIGKHYERLRFWAGENDVDLELKKI